MGRGVLAAALAAAVMFVWGFVGGHLLGIPPTREFSNSRTVAEAMRQSGDGDGVYQLPAPGASDGEAQLARGPRATVFYDAGEVDVDSLLVLTMAKGFLVLFAAGLLVAFLLERTSIRSYGGRVLFCTAFGLFAALYSTGGMWAWFHAPLAWSGPAVVHDLLAWAGAGLVIAAIHKPRV